jgi:hypothetical protein
MKYVTWAVAVAVMTTMAQPAWAARLPIHDAAESPEYGRKAGGMLGRGLLNGITFFVDTPVNIVNETRTGPPFIGTLVGLGKGLGCSTFRLLSGGVDVLTFWVPGFNGIPVSTSYDNCLATDGMMGSSAPAAHEMAPSTDTTWSTGSMTTPAEPAMPAPSEAPQRFSK